jgi:hypothetical protein
MACSVGESHLLWLAASRSYPQSSRRCALRVRCRAAGRLQVVRAWHDTIFRKEYIRIIRRVQCLVRLIAL